MSSRKLFNPSSRRRGARWVGTVLTTLLASVLVETEQGPSRPRPSPNPSVDEWFTERAQAVGLDFVHFNGMSGEFYFEEVMGSGVALFDYDNDGDLDVYIVQGQMLGSGKTLAEPLMPPRTPQLLTDRLYRNDLEIHPDGSRTIRFTDVTKVSGLDVR